MQVKLIQKVEFWSESRKNKIRSCIKSKQAASAYASRVRARVGSLSVFRAIVQADLFSVFRVRLKVKSTSGQIPSSCAFIILSLVVLLVLGANRVSSQGAQSPFSCFPLLWNLTIWASLSLESYQLGFPLASKLIYRASHINRSSSVEVGVISYREVIVEIEVEGGDCETTYFGSSIEVECER